MSINTIFIFIGRWYEFGHVDTKIVIGMLTALGSVFTVYLFCTPRKVSETNAILAIACTNQITLLTTLFTLQKYY